MLPGSAGKGKIFFPALFLSLLVRTKIASVSRQRPGGPGDSSCVIYSSGRLRLMPLRSAGQREGL